MTNSHSSNFEKSSGKRHFDQTDTWVERWHDFEDMFDDFDSAPDAMAGVWMESDLRQQKLELMRQLLEDSKEKSPFGDDEEILIGLKSSLGYFSYIQLEELQRLVQKIDEGLAEEHEQEKFEKSSKTEQRDQ